MNSKEGQNTLETMLAESLISKLKNLGANPQNTAQSIAQLDFNEVRSHLSRTDEDLKAQFTHLFQ